MSTLKLKRIYEDAASSDGFRVLVDRLWPRGLKKENAHVDLWVKNIAPSNELRKWFHHEDEKWGEFEQRYQKELTANKEALEEVLHQLQKHPVVTLLYGAHNKEHNNAVVLRAFLGKSLDQA